MALTASQIYSLARGAGFDADSAETMTAIAFAESSGIPSSAPQQYYPDLPIGLWQINMNPKYANERLGWFGISNKDQLKDPVVNANAARTIWLKQGYAGWEAYTKGMYRKFLPQAQQARANVEGASTPSPLPSGLDPTQPDTSIIDGWIGSDAGDAVTPQTAIFIGVAAAALLLLSLAKR